MFERMLNKEIKPTLEEFISYCGKTSSDIVLLHNFLQEQCHTSFELRFPYGKEYGWSIAHRKGKKLICDIFAEADAFTIMLRLTNQQFDEIYQALQPYAQAYIDHKYPCGSGGWIHYRVTKSKQLSDIKSMLLVKCS